MDCVVSSVGWWAGHEAGLRVLAQGPAHLLQAAGGQLPHHLSSGDGPRPHEVVEAGGSSGAGGWVVGRPQAVPQLVGNGLLGIHQLQTTTSVPE